MIGTGRLTDEDMRLFPKSTSRLGFLPRARGQLPPVWTGATARPKHHSTHGATCHPTVHNVDSSLCQHRAAEYAQAKRRTLNQNPEESEAEGLDHAEGIGYEHTYSQPQGINLSEPGIRRRMGSTPQYTPLLLL